MTKPIIVVKIPCKLLIVCHSSKRIQSFWSLITIVASDWPRTFFTARLFLFTSKAFCKYSKTD